MVDTTVLYWHKPSDKLPDPGTKVLALVKIYPDYYSLVTLKYKWAHPFPDWVFTFDFSGCNPNRVMCWAAIPNTIGGLKLTDIVL
jgi:hypothetical protein